MTLPRSKNETSPITPRQENTDITPLQSAFNSSLRPTCPCAVSVESPDIKPDARLRDNLPDEVQTRRYLKRPQPTTTAGESTCISPQRQHRLTVTPGHSTPLSSYGYKTQRPHDHRAVSWGRVVRRFVISRELPRLGRLRWFPRTI